MAGLSARQYDAHYRRLGLTPGASPSRVDEAANSLREKLSPGRFNKGPLQEICPIRLDEIDESAVLLIGYWQRYHAAPPSVQNRTRPLEQSISSHGTMVDLAAMEAKTSPILLVDEQERANQALLRAEDGRTDLTLVKPIGPELSRLSFSSALFRFIDGSISPTADVFKPLSIVGLIALASVWVALPLILVRIIGFIFADCNIDAWLEYFSLLAKVVPVCFIPPLVLYEYAFFRQMQFPFAGALRLPVKQAMDDCIERLTVESIGNSAGWSIESQSLELQEEEAIAGEIVAVYSGGVKNRKLPLKIHLRLEKLADNSSFLVYWFELESRILSKGRAVSCMKSARFELDRLIKES
ncbi:MAG: hypothetical protein K2Y39_16225 [Candidatus Obscuribacterales bacterium]|nr:hypothetical protein [Candidatus Obscuribacterales bacterium]